MAYILPESSLILQYSILDEYNILFIYCMPFFHDVFFFEVTISNCYKDLLRAIPE